MLKKNSSIQKDRPQASHGPKERRLGRPPRESRRTTLIGDTRRRLIGSNLPSADKVD